MRTTIQTLEALVDWLNEATHSPMTPYTQDGKLKANIGNYHLYQAYGRVGVNRICNEGGGVATLFELTTKKDLEAQLRAFLKGLEICKEVAA